MKYCKGGKAIWENFVKINKDPYSKACVVYTQKWVELMEEKMAEGVLLKDIWKNASYQADKGIGITGFMFGCAVGIVARTWKHGDELRRLHNIDCQCSNEGEKANEKKNAVLNPALISIGV